MFVVCQNSDNLTTIGALAYYPSGYTACRWQEYEAQIMVSWRKFVSYLVKVAVITCHPGITVCCASGGHDIQYIGVACCRQDFKDVFFSAELAYFFDVTIINASGVNSHFHKVTVYWFELFGKDTAITAPGAVTDVRGSTPILTGWEHDTYSKHVTERIKVFDYVNKGTIQTWILNRSWKHTFWFYSLSRTPPV
jgi:hypothetical protein